MKKLSLILALVFATIVPTLSATPPEPSVATRLNTSEDGKWIETRDQFGVVMATSPINVVPTPPPEFPSPGPIIVQNTDGSHSLVVNGTHYKLASPPEGVERPAPPPEGGSYPFTLTFKPESASQLNTNTTVFIYSTTNAALPLASWSLLTNVPGTWSNLTVNLPNQVQFFTGVESNKLGLGSFFPVESKPLLPGNRTLEIRKD